MEATLKTKLLGAHVSEDLHKLAHLTARSQGITFSQWLRNVVKANIDERALFFIDDAHCTKQNHSFSSVQK